MKTIHIKSKDIIDSDNFEMIDLDKKSSQMKIIGSDQGSSTKLMQRLILYRNMNNSANDSRHYDFKVYLKEISNKHVVIIEGDLNTAVQLMNMVELDEGVKILSDSAAALVNEALMEKSHQVEKHGQFFVPSLKQDIQPQKISSKNEDKIEKLAKFIEALSVDLDEEGRTELVEAALKKVNRATYSSSRV